MTYAGAEAHRNTRSAAVSNGLSVGNETYQHGSRSHIDKFAVPEVDGTGVGRSRLGYGLGSVGKVEVVQHHVR